MPPLQLRQEFPTLKAFKEALHAWAIEDHFEPRILKSDTGRVRVGCKRDPNCPFVIRCNWERKGGREPLARVTVMRDKHTCLNGVEWLAASGHMGGIVPQQPGIGGAGVNGHGNGMGGGMGVDGGMGMGGMGTVEIRQDEDGNIVGGARVLGPVEARPQRDSVGGGVGGHQQQQQIIPVLPKVQRNSASRLPFLMEILPRLMNITKDTSPAEIRECLLREYGAEVHLQQCRRAKTEILKKQTGGNEEADMVQDMAQQQQQPQDLRGAQGMNGMGSDGGDTNQQLFGDMNATPNHSPHAFTLHTATGVVTPVMPDRSTAALRTVGEAPVRCPYCVNHRWMRSIKDAVEHMSMHVVV